MDNDFFTQLTNAFHEVTLTQEERASMRARLAEAMRTAPLPLRPARRTASPYYFIYAHRALVFAAIVLLLVGSTAGTAFAAQGALPGDVLYPVKLGTEQVQTALATSAAAKAQVHAQLAQKRLEEAQQLAAQNKLTASTTQQLQQNFDAHASEAQQLASSLAQSDPGDAAQITVQLTSTLAANDAVLVSLGQESGSDDTRRNSEDLAAAVRAHVDALALAGETYGITASDTAPTAGKGIGAKAGQGSPVRTGALPRGLRTLSGSSTPTTTPSQAQPQSAATSSGMSQHALSSVALRLDSRAQDELAAAKGALANASLDASTSAQFMSQLDQAAQLTAAGEAALSAGDEHTAITNFNQAIAVAVRVETYVRASARFNTGILTPLLNLFGQGDNGAAAIDAQDGAHGKGQKGASDAPTSAGQEQGSPRSHGHSLEINL